MTILTQILLLIDFTNEFCTFSVIHWLYTGWFKKNLVLGFSEVPCKDIQKKIIWRLPLYKYTLVLFYKPNSIFKTKDAFCGHKFTKRRCLVQKGFAKNVFIRVSCKDIQKKWYDHFLYMNAHYFHFINQILSLKLKAHFTAISFKKAVVLHFL